MMEKSATNVQLGKGYTERLPAVGDSHICSNVLVVVRNAYTYSGIDGQARSPTLVVRCRRQLQTKAIGYVQNATKPTACSKYRLDSCPEVQFAGQGLSSEVAGQTAQNFALAAARERLVCRVNVLKHPLNSHHKQDISTRFACLDVLRRVRDLDRVVTALQRSEKRRHGSHFGLNGQNGALQPTQLIAERAVVEPEDLNSRQIFAFQKHVAYRLPEWLRARSVAADVRRIS